MGRSVRMDILPGQGTTSRLLNSRAEIRQDHRARLDQVRRRLRFAPGGLDETEVNRRCGWPVGAGACLRELAEAGEVHIGSDRRWRLGPSPQPQATEACNREATVRIDGPVLGTPLPACCTVRTPLRRPTDADGPLFQGAVPRVGAATGALRGRKRAARRPVVEIGGDVGGRAGSSMVLVVVALIPPDGATLREIEQRSGLTARQVSQTLARAKRAGRVRRAGRVWFIKLAD